MSKQYLEYTNTRKNRSIWDKFDSDLLQRLVESRIDRIANKNVDPKTALAKRTSWKEILSEFNKRSHIKRDGPQIRNHWRRIKWLLKNNTSTNGSEEGTTRDISFEKSSNAIDDQLMVYTKEEFIVDHSVCDDYDSSTPHDSVLHNDDHFKDRHEEKSIDTKNAEAQHYKNKCEEEIETIRVERSLKIKAFEADEKRKDEEHRLRLQHLEEEHRLKIELLRGKNS